MGRSEVRNFNYTKSKGNDVYKGLFNKKQIQDLEAETEFPHETITQKHRQQAERIRRMGTSSNMIDSGYSNCRALGKGWGK